MRLIAYVSFSSYKTKRGSPAVGGVPPVRRGTHGVPHCVHPQRPHHYRHYHHSPCPSPPPRPTVLTLTSDDRDFHSARLTSVLCVGQPGPTTVRFEVLTEISSDALGFGVSPLRHCADLTTTLPCLPGEGKWAPGLSLYSGGYFFHNGVNKRPPGIALQQGSVVELVVDRSDPEESTGGTVTFTVDDSVVVGKEAPVPLGFTEPAYIIISIRGKGNAVRLLQ